MAPRRRPPRRSRPSPPYAAARNWRARSAIKSGRPAAARRANTPRRSTYRAHYAAPRPRGPPAVRPRRQTAPPRASRRYARKPAGGREVFREGGRAFRGRQAGRRGRAPHRRPVRWRRWKPCRTPRSSNSGNGGDILLRRDGPDLRRAAQNPFGEQKAGSQFLVVAGGPHGDGDVAAIHADFQRLFHRQQVLLDGILGAAHSSNRNRNDGAPHRYNSVA